MADDGGGEKKEGGGGGGVSREQLLVYCKKLKERVKKLEGDLEEAQKAKEEDGTKWQEEKKTMEEHLAETKVSTCAFVNVFFPTIIILIFTIIIHFHESPLLIITSSFRGVIVYRRRQRRRRGLAGRRRRKHWKSGWQTLQINLLMPWSR